MYNSVTLVIALDSPKRNWAPMVKDILKKNEIDQVIIGISGKIFNKKKIGNILITKQPDQSIYECWNKILPQIQTTHFVFLGFGDDLFGLKKRNIIGDYIPPIGQDGRLFFHCGTVFSRKFMKLPFNENLTILADIEHYFRILKSTKIEQGVGHHGLVMEPGGMSATLSKKLVKEYIILTINHPQLFSYFLKKIIYLVMLRFNSK